MRHRKIKGRLNRRASLRKATLKCLANDLLTYQRIETTMAKAKALRGYVEPLITLSKRQGSVSARREAFRRLCDKDSVKNLFDKVGPLYIGVNGGYTRIMPFINRKGDGAQLAIIELVKRTIPDKELLGIKEEKPKALKKKAVREKEKAEVSHKEVPEKESLKEKKHAAPTVAVETKEEKSVEEVKKEKAKQEQKKIVQKGFFSRIFRRKSMG